MKAFLYGAVLQWKLDIRSRTMLITCYLVPLLFFAVMGGIFTSVMPETKGTLIQSMTVFGVTMGALIGVPPSLVEIYGSGIKKMYQANGVPLWLGLILTVLSSFVHLMIMSGILFLAAPPAFGAEVPENPGMYFLCTAIFTAVSLGVAAVIGLAVKDQAKTSMISIIAFLPSVMLSGIMFPADLLPEALETAGKLLPASWGYKLMTASAFSPGGTAPLLLIFAAAFCLCALLLHRIEK